jgi:Holliday junction resolvase RusA-like endonuclease
MELVRDIAAIEYKNQPLTTGPIELCLCFFLEHPKSHYRAGKFKHLLKSDAPLLHTIKPDLTKLVRAVEDALTGVIWKDDSQVSSACSLKQYAPFGSKPGVRIIVRSGG